MKKLILSTLVAAISLLPLTTMAATVFGFQVGGGSWTHAPSGNITSNVGGTGTSADLKNDLSLAEKSEGYTYFLIEHPVPLVPNFKYVNTKLTSAGSGTANVAFTFNNVSYNTVANLTTSLKLDQTDIILYYEILDNDLVSVDLGLTAKTIEGSAFVDDGSTASTATFKGTIPLLYAAVEIGLPAGFALAAEISTISAGANEITDTTMKIMYTTDFNLGVEAGIRTQTFKIDVDSVKTSMEFSGVFVGAFLRF